MAGIHAKALPGHNACHSKPTPDITNLEAILLAAFAQAAEAARHKIKTFPHSALAPTTPSLCLTNASQHSRPHRLDLALEAWRPPASPQKNHSDIVSALARTELR